MKLNLIYLKFKSEFLEAAAHSLIVNSLRVFID